MPRRFVPLLLMALTLPAGCARLVDAPDDARALTGRLLVVDGHIDVPYRLTEFPEDVAGATVEGDFDWPRARAGGLDAAFMAIFIDPALQGSGRERAVADAMIDLVDGIVVRAPDRFAHARTPDDIRRNAARGLVSLPMGMENGAPIGDDLGLLRHFYDRGIRYITLSHGRDNLICDSSYDTTRTWNGLSPFGVRVVEEMNRLGLMVDVSHVSDSAFYDVLRVARAPVIASHSSARHFTPGFERNLDDEMIRRIGATGGLVMVTFGSWFLGMPQRAATEAFMRDFEAYLDAHYPDRHAPEARAYYREQRRTHPFGTVDDVADHIDHVVRLAGIDHVGLGSDFDGVVTLPEGLQDVSGYPNLFAALRRRGYSEADLRKIAGENLLRVWAEVDERARALGAAPATR